MRKQGKARKGSNNIYFGVRCDPQLIERLRQRAAANRRGIGQELNHIIEQALAGPQKGAR
jgi:plasmid stability protein